MATSVYVDNNATTHLSARVKARLHELVDIDPGNPESPHSDGEYARGVVADARFAVADSLNAPERRVIFTGSGSESNTYAVEPLLEVLRRGRPLRVLTSRLEHSSVTRGMEMVEGFGGSVIHIRVTPSGVIDMEHLKKEARKGCNAIFVQWANNETGVVQPVDVLSAIASDSESYLHVDAAQAYGKIPIDLDAVSVDSLTITAHKLHGPKGIAALYSRAPKKLRPVVFGGQQEQGVRGGTHNVLGIGGFAAAVKERFEDFDRKTVEMKTLRDQLEQDVTSINPQCVVRGKESDRVPNTSCMTFPGADGSQMVAWLDAQGLQCSQTSACRSNRPEPSAVLTAMGLSEEQAYSTIRFSVSPLNTKEEIELAADLICRAYRAVAR